MVAFGQPVKFLNRDKLVRYSLVANTTLEVACQRSGKTVLQENTVNARPPVNGFKYRSESIDGRSFLLASFGLGIGVSFLNLYTAFLVQLISKQPYIINQPPCRHEVGSDDQTSAQGRCYE